MKVCLLIPDVQSLLLIYYSCVYHLIAVVKLFFFNILEGGLQGVNLVRPWPSAVCAFDYFYSVRLAARLLQVL